MGATPGSNVYMRSLVSYTGTGTPVGLASFVYQPTISNAQTVANAVEPGEVRRRFGGGDDIVNWNSEISTR